MEDKKFSTNLIVLITVVLVAGYFFYNSGLLFTKDKNKIVTFEDCVANGNPVMQSFPEQCQTKDGIIFANWRGAERTCTQVITPAQNPETKEVREFPTPCDVPGDWVKI